jgi:hypothetical protein
MSHYLGLDFAYRSAVAERATEMVEFSSLVPPYRVLPGNGEVWDIFTHLDEAQIN